ncbi:hypothetical protein DB30_05766 [Enhygromyxa salina]|uniref:Uncharacterized protein n=2 Tax=Enhygromyxa salina TaxID=215803 RepID=A0A0C2D5D1_9BACT|nr:hypothetical protein DB30_05766 [Enhygromyxa salina]
MLLWGAMLVSHILFLVIAHVAHGQDAGAGDLQTLSIVLTSVGVIVALGSALAVPLITRDQLYVTALIVRLAAAESVTIFGLMLAMLGAEMQWTYALTALGVMAHIAAFPSERDQEAHEQRRSGSRES